MSSLSSAGDVARMPRRGPLLSPSARTKTYGERGGATRGGVAVWLVRRYTGSRLRIPSTRRAVGGYRVCRTRRLGVHGVWTSGSRRAKHLPVVWDCLDGELAITQPAPASALRPVVATVRVARWLVLGACAEPPASFSRHSLCRGPRKGRRRPARGGRVARWMRASVARRAATTGPEAAGAGPTDTVTTSLLRPVAGLRQTLVLAARRFGAARTVTATAVGGDFLSAALAEPGTIAGDHQFGVRCEPPRAD